MKTNSLQGLTKSALPLLTTVFLVFGLHDLYIRRNFDLFATNRAIPTVFHNATAYPIETQRYAVNDSAPEQHAYVFYATEPEYACSALINIDRLRNQFSSIYRIIIIAKPSIESKFLKKFIAHNATVIPYEPPPIPAEYPYYQDVLLKLVSFRLHQYIPSLERVLVLDSDQLVMQSLDHLFSLPSVDLAAPRVYWGDDAAQFTSALMLIKLSDRIWDKVNAGIESVDNFKFDMDIVNKIFRNFTLILPGDYCTLNSHLEDNWLPSWYEGNQWATDKGKGTHKKRSSEKVEHQENGNTVLQQRQEKREIALADGVLEERNEKADATIEEASELSPLQKETQRNLREYQASLNKENRPAESLGNESNASPQPEPPIVAQQTEPETSPEDQKSKETSELRWRKHDLMGILQRIYEEEVKVVHFTAIGKPWDVTENRVRSEHPDAHPLLPEQFRLWRLKAKEICPGFDKIEI